MKKKFILITIFIVAIFAVVGGIVAFRTLNNKLANSGSGASYDKELRNAEGRVIVNQDLPSCGDKMDFFTRTPIDYKDLLGIVPLGFVGSAPEHVFPTDHIYFHIKRDKNDVPYEVPIYSPGDMVITRIKAVEMDRPVPNSKDYYLYFTPCQDFEAFFFHVSTVSEKIESHIKPPFEYCSEEAYNLGRFENTMCEKDVWIPMDAGEPIGTIGQLFWQFGVDMGAYDLRIDPLRYANPKRWDDIQLRGIKFKNYIVCPLDYFTGDIEQELKSRLGDSHLEILRTIEPVCGTIEQDVIGTAQGVWANEKDKFGPSLSLIHDFIDPSGGAFAVGTAVQSLPTNVYYFKPVFSGNVNLDFNLVKDDEIYCYEGFEGELEEKLPYIILIQLTGEDTLKIEGREQSKCPAGPWEFESPTEFER